MEFWISLTCLVLVLGINIVGIYDSRFKDNLLQSLGMIALCIWCMSEIVAIVDSGVRSTGTLLHVALFLYFAGTAAKVVYFGRRDQKSLEAT